MFKGAGDECTTEKDIFNNSIINTTEQDGQKKTKSSTSKALSSCKTLQRKLELKVERVKRSYNQRNEIQVKLLCSEII